MTARSLELEISPGVVVFGEVHEAEGAHGAVLLVHDRGADLDVMRPFTVPLQTLGLTTVLLDLPGHGLSAGDWDLDGARAVRLALDECRRLHDAVAVVAAGSGCALVYGLHPAPVRVAALVAPGLGSDDLAAAEAWRVVPVITLGDPCDAPAAESMELVSRWIRAWSLRMSVHYLDAPDGGPESWTPHMTHSAAAFIAEQLAYAARSAGPPPPTDDEQGVLRRA
jgi:pimeloyl-ACP methyl ester carboxylesterase